MKVLYAGLAVAGILGIAAPAFADGATPGCAGFNCPTPPPSPTPPTNGYGDGQLIAATVSVTVHHGAGTHGRSGKGSSSYTVSTPCGYYQDGTGADMYQAFPNGDGLYISAAAARAHKNDHRGHWFHYDCTFPFAGTQAGNDVINQVIAQGSYEIFSDPGRPVQPPVPPSELESVASDEARKSLPVPEVASAPAGHAAVRLPTWIWLTGGTASDVSVTATAGANTVTVTGRMTGMGFNDVPAFATTDSGCAGGGRPYSAGVQTDCSITFGQAAPAVSFTVSTTWTITVTGAQLTGPDTVTRTSNPITLAVAQVEAIEGH